MITSESQNKITAQLQHLYIINEPTVLCTTRQQNSMVTSTLKIRIQQA